MMKAKINNSKKKVHEEAGGTKYCIISGIISSVSRSRCFYFLPLEEYILPDLQMWSDPEWREDMKRSLGLKNEFIFLLSFFFFFLEIC